MRLIDADKVIEELDGSSLYLEVNPSMTTGDIIKKTVEICNAYFLHVINETPTAYDVDAVVRELEDKVKLHARHQIKCEMKGMDFCADRHEHKIQALDEAIVIVKRGGRNE